MDHRRVRCLLVRNFRLHRHGLRLGLRLRVPLRRLGSLSRHVLLVVHLLSCCPLPACRRLHPRHLLIRRSFLLERGLVLKD